VQFRKGGRVGLRPVLLVPERETTSHIPYEGRKERSVGGGKKKKRVIVAARNEGGLQFAFLEIRGVMSA